VTVPGSSAALRTRLLVVTLCGGAGLLAGTAAARLQPPVYQARARLLAAPVEGRQTGTWARLVDAPGVTATVLPGTDLVEITASDRSPARARDVADAAAAQLVAVVHRLDPASGGLRTAGPAALPTAPAGLPAPAGGGLGLLGGLALGGVAARRRRTAGGTVTGGVQAAHLTGAPMLGVVPDDPAARATALLDGGPRDGSARAEAFRTLRTNLGLPDRPGAPTSIVVTGVARGEGRTAAAANLAVLIARCGRPVLLVDADLRRPHVADLFGLPGAVGLTSVLTGRADLDDAVRVWRDDLPLEVLPAGPVPPDPSELLGGERMADLLGAYTAAGRVVVLDAPPLTVTDAAVLARLADGAVLVVRAGRVRDDELAAAAEALRTAGATLLGTVLHRVPRRAAPYPAVPDPPAPDPGAAGTATPGSATPDLTTPGPAVARTRHARRRRAAGVPVAVRSGATSRGPLDDLLAGLSAAPSAGARPPQDGGRRLPEDLDVERDGPVLDVVEIESYGLGPVEVGAPAHLPQPRQSRFDEQAAVHVPLVPGDLGGQGRARADQ